MSKTLPDDLLHVREEEGIVRLDGPMVRRARRRLSDYGRRVALFPGLEARPSRAFRTNLPAVDAFPTATWARITARRSRHVPLSLLTACEPIGYAPLRTAVAHYLGMSRGVHCTPEQVVIVSGVQEALDLVARLFLNPRDLVCMEDPGYPGAAVAFESVGARLVFVPLDDQGMMIRDRRLRNARLIYVTPGHQFPLGMTMSLPRRLELLEWARTSGTLIFEDDYDSEYRYSGRPVPALHGLDRAGQVFFAGSFNKVLFPSLRLGYLVVPSDVVDRFAAAKSASSRHAPLLEQAVLHEFIAEGHFGRHLRRMRELYASRLAVLLENGRRLLAGLLEISPIEAGLQTVGWLGGRISGERAAAAAGIRNVDVTPLSHYYRGPVVREGLQLGFAAVDAREISRGVRDLAAALETERSATGRL